MKRLLICLWLNICCFALAAQNVQRIQEAMADYDYETALMLIDQEPPTLPLLYQKGKVLKGLYRYKEALEAFQTVIEQDSVNARARLEAAECYKALSKYGKALDCYKEAIRLNPAHKYAQLQYTSLLTSQRRYKEALEESERIIAGNDSSAYVLHLRATCLAEVSDSIDPVIEAYQEIRRKYPEDYLAVAKLGNIYIAGQMYDEAIDLTEAYSTTVDSTNTDINRLNAQAYCLNKDYQTAIHRYEPLLQEKDSTFLTCFYAGISYYAINFHYEARQLLEQAHKQDPTNINVLYYLGRTCSRSSWKRKGVEYLEQAIGLALPTDSLMSRLYTGLVDCYKQANQYRNQAEAILTQYKEYDREKHKLLYDAAFVYYYRLKNTRRAEQCLEAYLKTRPKELVQETAADGSLIVGENNRYHAAEAWLKDIQKKKKQEDFFKGKVDTARVAPAR